MEITEHGEADFYQNKRKLSLTITKALGNSKQPLSVPRSGDNEVVQTAPGAVIWWI